MMNYKAAMELLQRAVRIAGQGDDATLIIGADSIVFHRGTEECASLGEVSGVDEINEELTTELDRFFGEL